MNQFKTTCLCGSVKCSFFLPINMVVQCYCSMCRKMQGSDYSSWVSVKDSQTIINCGREFLSEYQLNEKSKKVFCSKCGTIIYAINGKHFPNHKMFALGTIDKYSQELLPKKHVYLESKAEWVKVSSLI